MDTITTATPLQQERHRRNRWVVCREITLRHRQEVSECLDRWVQWEKEHDQR